MSEIVLKPKIPISQDGTYYYPLTSYDQIIMPDGNEWNGKITINNQEPSSSGNFTINASNIGAAPAEHSHTQYFETSKIIYSSTEPVGSQGMIWFKPAE